MKMFGIATAFILLAGNANATSYTYCKNGTLYQCGGGDACHPQPCHIAGSCKSNSEAGHDQEDMNADVSTLLDVAAVNVHSCL